LSAAIGSLVIHTEGPWDESVQPSEFGQILANLVSIALMSGPPAERVSGMAQSVDTVLEGTTTVAMAVGIIAEHRHLEVVEARHQLTRLARVHNVTVTAHAQAVVDAQNSSPTDLASTGFLVPPADQSAPRQSNP
jgi:hypothetical protein